MNFCPDTGMKKHIVIPDCQIKPGVPTDHLEWVGHYIVEQQPTSIICLGDFADMHSLSSYDFGKKSYEGRRLGEDIECANRGMDRMMRPIQQYNSKRRLYKEKVYRPTYDLTLGNHEQRLERAIEADAKLDGLLGYHLFNFVDHGWTVHDYLSPVDIDGVSYCHLFVQPRSGKGYSSENITYLLTKIGYSFTMGHVQALMYGQRPLSNGKRLCGLVVGANYMHDEKYRGEQSNTEWRGIVVKHEVSDGAYDIMTVSLDFLCRKYEGMRLWKFTKKKYPNIFNNSIWMKRQEMSEAV